MDWNTTSGVGMSASSHFWGRLGEAVKDLTRIVTEPEVVIRQEFIEECKDLLVEGEFTARWALVETYHALGLLIIGESKDQPRTKFIATVAVKLEKSERLLWYAVAFAEKFPELDKLPDGKLISWKGVIVKYLTSGSDDLHEHTWIKYLVCTCGARKKDGNEVQSGS